MSFRAQPALKTPLPGGHSLDSYGRVALGTGLASGFLWRQAVDLLTLEAKDWVIFLDPGWMGFLKLFEGKGWCFFNLNTITAKGGWKPQKTSMVLIFFAVLWNWEDLGRRLSRSTSSTQPWVLVPTLPSGSLGWLWSVQPSMLSTSSSKEVISDTMSHSRWCFSFHILLTISYISHIYIIYLSLQILYYLSLYVIIKVCHERPCLLFAGSWFSSRNSVFSCWNRYLVEQPTRWEVAVKRSSGNERCNFCRWREIRWGQRFRKKSSFGVKKHRLTQTF